MDSTIDLLASQNHLLIAAIVGGVAGLCGGALSFLLIKIFPKLQNSKQRVFTIIMASCIALGLGLANPMIKEQRKNDEMNKVLTELAKIKIYEVIFSKYPEEKEALRQGIEGLNTPEELFSAGRSFGQAMVAKYFFPNLVKADDSLVLQYIENQVKLIESVQSNPKVCHELAMGSLSSASSLQLIPKDLIKNDFEIKGQIIESGLNNNTPPEILNLQAAVLMTSSKYKENGYDRLELDKFHSGAPLSNEEGCGISARFLKTLSSLKNDGARAYKSFVNLQFNHPAK